MKKRQKRIAFVVLFLFLSGLLTSGCNVETDRSEKPSPDWSRGLLLGRADLKQPVALAVDTDRHVHLVWCNESQLHYAHLDDQARMVSNQVLDVNTPLPRKPQLEVDAANRVHLAWLSRDQGIQQLFHSVIDRDGHPADLRRLSLEDENVTGFRMYPLAGEVAFVWSSDIQGDEQGLVHATLDASATRQVLALQGIDPFVLVGEHGDVHLVWLQANATTARQVYYATLSPGAVLVPEGGRKLSSFEFAEGAVYFGPSIGLETDDIYVFWGVQNLGGGLSPTAADSYYVTFKSGDSTVRSGVVGLPPLSQPDYSPYAGPYGYTQLDLLSPDEILYSSDFVNAPSAAGGQQSELPVAFSLMTHSQSDSQIQVAMGVFAQGNQVGYQLASKTPGASLIPLLASDIDRNLHLAWIDTAGFRAYDVYYATNAPEAKQWLNRTSTSDVVLVTADVIWGVFSGLGLLPIAGIWVFSGLVWIVGFFTFSGYEDLEYTGGKVGFAVSIVIYVLAKSIFLPGLSAGTPFLQLFPKELAVVFSIAVPVLLLLLGIGAVYLYSRRAARPTIFRAYFILALVDTVLTLVLYAPGLFNS
ncbi:MAG: hypothetical protein JXA89_17465 [Anaerolineae bacterium]|nr:hypothetical protein [Anaerolineae bacterium]